MEKQVVVLCGHRSGSSVVAGILHQLGVDMGKELMPPSKHNPKGYFEDMEFFRVNFSILYVLGVSWFSIPQEVLSVGNLFEDRIKNLIESRDGVWGWKDPRTAITLPLYWPHLTNPHFVVVERPHLSIAKSLNERDNIPVKDALDFTNRYYKFIYERVQEYRCPTMIIRYDHLLKHPEEQIDRLSSFVGLYGKIDPGFIDRGLCHH